MTTHSTSLIAHARACMRAQRVQQIARERGITELQAHYRLRAEETLQEKAR